MTPGEYCEALAASRHGPHDDAATISAARLAGESVRFLNYATGPAADGLTEPVTAYHLAGELTTAVYRLPQLLSQLADWLTAQAASGRLADTAGRPPGQVTDAACTALSEAMDHADRLARALAAAQNLTAGLYLTTPDAEGEPR